MAILETASASRANGPNWWQIAGGRTAEVQRLKLLMTLCRSRYQTVECVGNLDSWIPFDCQKEMSKSEKRDHWPIRIRHGKDFLSTYPSIYFSCIYHYTCTTYIFAPHGTSAFVNSANARSVSLQNTAEKMSVNSSSYWLAVWIRGLHSAESMWLTKRVNSEY